METTLLVQFLFLGFAMGFTCADTNHSQESSPKPPCVAPSCNCTLDNSLWPTAQITANCQLRQIGDLTDFIEVPKNISTLILKVRDFYTVPRFAFKKFPNLLNLTLSDNSIAVLAKDAFEGLKKLRYLNLRQNKIRFWDDDNLTAQLPSLEMLDLTGNPTWLPTDAVLGIAKLREIKGSTWTKECFECSLVRNHSSQIAQQYSKGRYGDYIVWHCRGTDYAVSKETQLFGHHQFLPQCFRTDKKCYHSQVQATKSHRCWNTDNYVLYLEYVIGIVGVVLNATVVTVTWMGPLKYNVAMLLVSNLALSDLLYGIYSISITVARQSASYTTFVTYLDDLCSVLGFLWILAQFSTIQTSVLLTLERYTTIVFSMKPHTKPTPRTALICMGISWLMAFLAATLPLVGVGSYVTNTYCIPLQPSKDDPSTFWFSVGMSLVGIILYSSTIPLYLRIFVFVRKTSHQVGIKRDGKIARRISLLVLSNMLFFITPIIIALLWLLTDIFKKNISVEARNVLVGVFPLVCFSINSLVNPLLYAFRNNRFRQALKMRLRKVVPAMNSSLADISLRLRTESKTN